MVDNGSFIRDGQYLVMEIITANGRGQAKFKNKRVPPGGEVRRFLGALLSALWANCFTKDKRGYTRIKRLRFNHREELMSTDKTLDFHFRKNRIVTTNGIVKRKGIIGCMMVHKSKHNRK